MLDIVVDRAVDPVICTHLGALGTLFKGWSRSHALFLLTSMWALGLALSAGIF